MMVRIISILILVLVVAAQGAYAEEVKLQQGQLILNANAPLLIPTNMKMPWKSSVPGWGG